MTTNAADSRTSRVNEIDLLRFVAAISVVFYHFAFRGHAGDAMTVLAYPWLSGVSRYGYLGVQLFFLISGFVILMTASAGNVQRFVISRVVRLYPAFWACCTLTFLVTLWIGAPRFTAETGQFLANLTLLSGFVGVRSIDGVYWSLFVELQFYALVGVVLLLGQIHRAALLLMLWLGAVLLLEIYPSDKLQYLLIADYAAFFIAGAYCFLIWSKGLTMPRLLVVGVCWMHAVYRSVVDVRVLETNFNVNFSEVAVAGVVTACFGAMLAVSLRRTGFFSRRDWIVLGALTYPIFLLHQHIGYMLFNAGYGAINVHILFWGVLVLLLGLAYLVHTQVEGRLAPRLKRLLEQTTTRLLPVPRQ